MHTVQMDPFACCVYASQLVRAAGFELRWRAISTESLYYGWPARDELLRLSAHSVSRTRWRQKCLPPIAATITFREAKISQDKVRLRVAQAIGMYMIKTGGIVIGDRDAVLPLRRPCSSQSVLRA